MVLRMMNDPLHALEAEMAKLDAHAMMEAIPGLPAGTLAKISDVSRANALIQLVAIMSDEEKDDMVRMGAANIVLQATMPTPLSPNVSVQVVRDPDEQESE